MFHNNIFVGTEFIICEAYLYLYHIINMIEIYQRFTDVIIYYVVLLLANGTIFFPQFEYPIY